MEITPTLQLVIRIRHINVHESPCLILTYSMYSINITSLPSYSKLFFSKMRITRIVGIKLKTKIIYFLWALLTVDFLILKPIFISKSRNHKYLHWEVSVSKNASENNLYKAYINSQTNLWMVVTRDIWFKSLNKKGKKRNRKKPNYW